ncbi:MAG: hypothetical protein ABIR24_00825, partial [Verrucomicrobiota bacterium]
MQFVPRPENSGVRPLRCLGRSENKGGCPLPLSIGAAHSNHSKSLLRFSRFQFFGANRHAENKGKVSGATIRQAMFLPTDKLPTRLMESLKG